MPLNFNITPYNDDYNETKHFYRILFRPSVAVQARELTQEQTILQQQLTYLGNSIYQHGSMVIPGQIATDPKTNYVRLQPTYGFIGLTPIPINLALFNNQIIQGETTGLQAQVVFTVPAVNTDSPTIYVKYLNTGTNGATVFASDEVLSLLNSTTGLAAVETNAPTGLAISAQIDEGVYYIWGFFVRVEQQYLLLNKYSSVVSCRVGLEIAESIVTPEEDPSLNDNAQSSTNYAAPGAHRYKIDLTLTSKDLNDTTTDNNFVELTRLFNSVTQSKVTTDTYSIVLKEMATRMNDANGDFAVRNFAIDVREHLDTSFVTAGMVTGATVEVLPSTPATISLAASASAVDDTYNNMQIYLSNGSGAGQNFTITNYIGLTKTAQLDQDYKPNQVADTTTNYIIADPTKINRGIYPPAPADPQNPPPGYPLVPKVNDVYQWGNNDKLAVGMESGRAYVDGYRIDTLSTTYVEMNKARDLPPGQATNAMIPTPVGAFMFVKNLKNIPLTDTSVGQDFLQIYFSNIKSVGSFDATQNGLGTARVHSIEYVPGSGSALLGQADPEAVFKMYLFNIVMNPGVDINAVRAFYCVNSNGHNYTGVDGLDTWGDICSAFNAINVNGVGMIPGVTITGPSGVGTEKLVSYDAINNNIITESVSTNGTQILTSGTFTTGSGGTATTGTLSGRTQIFNTVASTLIYPMPQQLIKTVRAADNSIQTDYFIRKTFRAGRSTADSLHTYNYQITTTSDTLFSEFNTTDYMACVVADTNPSNIGSIIDLSHVAMTYTTGNAVLQFSISGAGPGGTTTQYIKLVATMKRIAVQEKSKALTYDTLAVSSPTATISLHRADIVNIIAIHDSGHSGTYATVHDPDIKNQYVFDTGQRDYFYDVGSVTKLPAAPGPTIDPVSHLPAQLLIEFNYFAHSAGDYFSVDSYSTLNNYVGIPTYMASNGRFYALRDCLDFRPRREDAGLYGFSGGGSGFSAPLQPSNTTTCDFQYWLPRIDKIYLDQYGNFNLISGTPAQAPKPPADPIDGMMLYTIALNPYTMSTSDMTITPTKNPRYTMHDIGKLEDRIANLEYYTNLNQLETQTATYSVTDTKTGLDRFKNGFVVDNFVDHSIGNVFDSDYNCAVDPTNNTLRPVFVQNSNQMVFQTVPSSGYVNRSNMLILPYTEAISIQQTFATDIINVNPFAVFTYYGDIALNPPTDTWKDTVQLPAINVSDTTALAGYKYLNQWSGTTWGDWQTTWVGEPQSTTASTITSTVVNNGAGGGGNELGDDAAVIANIIANDPNTWQFTPNDTIIHINGQAYSTGPEWADQAPVQVAVNGAGGGDGSTTTTTTTTVDTTQQLQQTRVGTQTMTAAQLSSQTINNAIVDVSLSPYIRSRRIQVIGKHFKPNTRLFPFFDGINVSAFCRPYSDPQVTASLTGIGWTTQTMTWGGDFSPQENNNEGTTSDQNDTGQNGIFSVGPLNTPIMTDSLGTTTLFFEIPCTTANKFRVGVRQFRLTDSSTNATTADSYGDANYNAAGIIQQNQDTITSIYTPEVITKQVDQSQVITQDLGSTSSSTSTTTDTGGGGGTDGAITLWLDPVAQSFLVKEHGGCYVSSIDVFFQTSDASVPITMQIRNMVNGYPGQDVVPFSEKVLYPNNPTLSALTVAGTIPDDTVDPLTPQVINVSDNASLATRFVFDCPVYLNDGTEYAFVLIANSVQYYLYTAKIGGTVVGSTNIVSTPPYLGNLFKSQNASTWVADPSQNLKFTINKAVFDPNVTGELYFTNSSVQPQTLLSLPFQTEDGTNLVRVYQKAHGMPKGAHSNSYVTLSNVAAGTYNGVTDVMLNKTFPINNVDLNSYTIDVSGTDFGTSRIGPDGVVATRNIQFDSICPVVNSFSPTGTSIGWGGLFTTGKSPHNNNLAVQEPYMRDQAPYWTPITPNTTSNFLAPRMVASDINETNSIVGATPYDRKSMIFQATLGTTNANLTPVVDLTRVSAILINNQIDDPSFANYTIQAMDQGITIPSEFVTDSNYLIFDSNVLIRVVAVTGGAFVAPPSTPEYVTGQGSGARGKVVSWDGNTLTLNTVTGVFQDNEAIEGETSNAVGTVSSFQYLNTITNLSPGTPPTPGHLDFSVFIPGYALTITGTESECYNYTNPVTILSVVGNQIIVDADPPFAQTASPQTNIGLTQYVRFINESGPSNCTATSRYITRQFNLQNASNSLNVIFSVNRPAGAFVDCYYRILAANSTQPFSTIPWVLMNLDTTVDSGISTNPAQFKDYSYTANNIGPFTAFSVKIVMRGGNSSQVPKIQSFRGIALAV
jgi:hypothetical protein